MFFSIKHRLKPAATNIFWNLFAIIYEKICNFIDFNIILSFVTMEFLFA